jgi:hypothetical protein
MQDGVWQSITDRLPDAALRSLRLLVFQSAEGTSTAKDAQAWVNTLFRILGLMQVTMLVFAFRARTKRT